MTGMSAPENDAQAQFASLMGQLDQPMYVVTVRGPMVPRVVLSDSPARSVSIRRCFSRAVREEPHLACFAAGKSPGSAHHPTRGRRAGAPLRRADGRQHRQVCAMCVARWSARCPHLGTVRRLVRGRDTGPCHAGRPYRPCAAAGGGKSLAGTGSVCVLQRCPRAHSRSRSLGAESRLTTLRRGIHRV